MQFLKAAEKLAKRGFYVFPLMQGGKLPTDKEFTPRATNRLERLPLFWFDSVTESYHDFNVGIACEKYGENEALLIVDVDVKEDKKGDETLLQLELNGFEFPKTCTQKTPTGGFHLIYKVKKPVKQGTDVLGRGLDIRSHGGYIVGAGSLIEGFDEPYTIDDTPVADAPAWLVAKCGEATLEKPSATKEERKEILSKVNQKLATEKALDYLFKDAPLAVQGSGGDATTFQVCARLKDFGLTEENALQVLLDNWNERCSPPWDVQGLSTKIRNAYSYTVSKPALLAPETQFTEVKETEQLNAAPPERGHPFVELNKEYAFVVNGGGAHILWETVDAEGNEKVEHISVQAFHQKLAALKLDHGSSKNKSLTENWIKSPIRRSYDGIVFLPGVKAPDRFYNLWRGFSVEPLDKNERASAKAKEGLDAFLEHALKNICANDERLFQWLIGYFAHMVQKPIEKPLTALVFRGGKGTGKNALINIVGNLFKKHFLVTSNRRYLLGNFNSHLENLILFVLDEAFWSGDKQTEGVMKDLITGDTHVIERKGQESYTVKNCTRIVILGNEDWIVPASDDERRYSVFNVGDGRKQDRNFFHNMRVNMSEHGGNRLLLRYLLDFDLSKIDVNHAPKTPGLIDQKLQSLNPLKNWIFYCLVEGYIPFASDFSKEWPSIVTRAELRESFKRYLNDKRIKYWNNNELLFVRDIKYMIKSISHTRKRSDEGREPALLLPSLDKARADFEEFIGGKINWDNVELDDPEKDFTSLL